MKRLVVDVDEKTHRKVKRKTADEGKTIREVILDLVNSWLKK